MNTPNPARTQQLLAKFLAIAPALELLNYRLNYAGKRLTIGVERLDANLLSNRPRLLDGSAASLTSDQRPGLCAWQHEAYFACTTEGAILGRLGYLTCNDLRRDEDEVRYLLTAHAGRTDLLVRVVVTGWCQRRADRLAGSPIGTLQEVEYAVTVYRLPDQGLDDLLAGSWNEDNLRMHFSDIFGAPKAGPEMDHFLGRLQVPMSQFVEHTFLTRIKPTLPKDVLSKSWQLGEVEIDCATWDGAAKARIQFTRGDVMVRFFYDEKKQANRLYLNGIDGTVNQVIALLDAVTSAAHTVAS